VPAKPQVDALQLPDFRAATSHCDRGEYGEAKALLRELSNKYPDNATIKAHLHFAASGEHLERGRARHAAAELKRALSADPNFEPAKKALAKLGASRLRRH
jgi:Tfp pilus assembly protein PilF